MKKISFSALFMAFAALSVAQVKLPTVISNDMVLQQESQAALWGKATPQKSVTIKTSWDNKKYKVTAGEDSIFRLRVTTPKGSFTPYNIDFTCGTTTTVENVLIGEVWLCSGQSNMEMPMKGFGQQPITGSQDDIANSGNKNLRCFTVEKQSVITPQYDCKGSWAIASPSTTGDFSATAYYFGRMLQQAIGLPVGLIHTSWGGSAIEAWIPQVGYKQFPNIKLPQTPADNRAQNQTPTVLFNGMIQPILGYNVKGAIWYQGESNRNAYELYPKLFAEMHKQWNQMWGCGNFPIYFCQIAPYVYGNKPEDNSAFIREAQMKVAQEQANTGMAVLMDAGEWNCIHPANKKVAGERLAFQAMSKLYGFTKLNGESPRYKEMQIKENGRIVVLFDNAPLGLYSASGKWDVKEFEIAGADKKFYPAKARVNGSAVEVWNDDVKSPVAVRYAFKTWVMGDLFGVNELPVSSFRTDNWDDVK